VQVVVYRGLGQTINDILSGLLRRNL